MAAAQDQAVKFQFEVENLLPANQKALQNQLKVVSGVSECAVAGNKVTLTVKAGESLKISDVKAIVAALKPVKDEKIAIKLDNVKLEGTVWISFSVEKNHDKIHGALYSIPTITNAKKVGDEFEIQVKSPAGTKLIDVCKAVAKATECFQDKPMDCLKETKWIGPGKPAAKEQPKTETPNPAPPSAQPPTPAPPPQAKPPPAPPKKPGG